MNVRTDSLVAAQQLRVVVERQVRVEAVDDMHLGDRLMAPLRSLSQASSDIVYAPDPPGFRRANEQKRQLATQTLVASSLMLWL